MSQSIPAHCKLHSLWCFITEGQNHGVCPLPPSCIGALHPQRQHLCAGLSFPPLDSSAYQPHLLVLGHLSILTRSLSPNIYK